MKESAPGLRLKYGNVSGVEITQPSRTCWWLHMHESDIKGARMPIMQIEHLIPVHPSVTQHLSWSEINTPIT